MCIEAVVYRKNGDLVTIRGFAYAGANPEIYNLPEGFRPHTEQRFSATREHGGNVIVTVMPNGVIVADQTAAGWVCLDGLEFKVN